MLQDERNSFDRALQRARTSAYPSGDFVGQESFMRAGELLSLAERAGVAPGVRLLDLCCGVAGPGRFITSRMGCSYVGVDSNPSAIALARERAVGLDCRFEVARIPPIPAGPHDVVMLLETILAFRDKDELLRAVSEVLPIGGRFAFTLEEGHSLTDAERAAMPDEETVWLVPLREVHAALARAGMRVTWQTECSRSHRDMADALIAAFEAHEAEITAEVGSRALEELVAGHRLWSQWLRTGRVRKFALVAEKAG